MKKSLYAISKGANQLYSVGTIPLLNQPKRFEKMPNYFDDMKRVWGIGNMAGLAHIGIEFLLASEN